MGPCVGFATRSFPHSGLRFNQCGHTLASQPTLLSKCRSQTALYSRHVCPMTPLLLPRQGSTRMPTVSVQNTATCALAEPDLSRTTHLLHAWLPSRPAVILAHLPVELACPPIPPPCRPTRLSSVNCGHNPLGVWLDTMAARLISPLPVCPVSVPQGHRARGERRAAPEWWRLWHLQHGGG